MRLLLFPYAGGGAAMYRTWPAILPDGIEVIRVQPPGRESRIREAPFSRIEELVGPLVEILGPLTDVPFAVFGHSMGALTGFSFVRALRRRSLPLPARLIVSGWRAPHLPGLPSIHHLPEPEFIAEIRQRYGGISDAVLGEPELLELFLPLLRSDIALCETAEVTTEAPLDCSLTVFGGRDDESVSREKLDGWRDHAGASFEIRTFPGGHFFIDAPEARVAHVVAEILEGDLSAMRGRGGSR